MMTVLIVEDNALNLRLLEALLVADGYHVVSATSGRECVERVRSARPDLIFMDLQLPDADGLDLTRDLKVDAETRHIPVVAVTARSVGGDEESARAAGCDDYLPKPVSRSALRACLQRLVSAQVPPSPGIA